MKVFLFRHSVLLLLFPLLVFSSCDLEDPSAGINAEEVIRLTAPSDQLLANGKDQIVLTAELGELSAGNELVTFSTSNGFFPLSTTSDQRSFDVAASNKMATLSLTSSTNTDEDVIVLASVQSADNEVFQATKLLTFNRAFPDNMILTSEKSIINPDRIDFANITVKLFRENGVPSDGTTVNFEVIELDSARADIVPFAFSEADATATASIKSANGFPGEIQLKASCQQQDGGILERVINLGFSE